MKSHPPRGSFPTLRRNARVRLVQWLYALSYTQGSGNPHLRKLLDEQAQTASGAYDQNYFQRLLHSLVQHQPAIDRLLQEVVDRDLKTLGRIELNVLRLACLEMSSVFGLPPKVVTNEAIEIAKSFGASESFKFINGVLHLVIKKLPIQLDGADLNP